ncbi:MAG: hypothetical protein EA403_12810 [Spirochaetaceae bacterium]|nr:MAG: hypothetical protein EA403_12810 [Spirochaetaceae bacterium]
MVLDEMVPYIERRVRESGKHARSVLRHMLGLFAGRPGARRYKRMLSGPMDVDLDVRALLTEAMRAIPDAVLHEPPPREDVSVCRT